MAGIRYDSISDLPPPLREQAARLIRQQEQHKKKSGLQSTANRDDFDSEGEREYYNAFLKPRERAGEVTDIRQQVQYQLIPPFTNSDGRQITGIFYTADFVYHEVATNKEVIVEVKARKRLKETTTASGQTRRRNRSITDTEASRLRWKLLQYVFRDDKSKKFVKWYRGEPYA